MKVLLRGSVKFVQEEERVFLCHQLFIKSAERSLVHFRNKSSPAIHFIYSSGHYHLSLVQCSTVRHDKALTHSGNSQLKSKGHFTIMSTWIDRIPHQSCGREFFMKPSCFIKTVSAKSATANQWAVENRSSISPISGGSVDEEILWVSYSTEVPHRWG